MEDSAGSIRNVVAHLRDMIDYCRDQHRDDLRWDYEEAVQVVRSKIFGKLPPRKVITGYPGYQPDNPPVPVLAAGTPIQERDKPLKKVIARITKPYRSWTVTYDELECGHQFLIVGDNTPAKRRRCAHCARDIQAKKKPASVKRPSSTKAVSA